MAKQATKTKTETEKGTEVAELSNAQNAIIDMGAVAEAIVENHADDAMGDFPAFVRVQGKTGEIVTADGSPFPEDGLYLNVHSIRAGMTLWNDVQGHPPVDKVHRYIVQDATPIDGDALEQMKGHSWKPFYDMTMQSQDDGAEYTFQCSTTSAINSLKNLLKKLFAGAVDLNTKIPVVKVNVEGFSTNFGKVYKPVFVVEDFVDASEIKFEMPVGENSI